MAIRLDNLSLEIEKKRILKNISFSVERGENILIIGPSGAGKTSLINVLAGIIPNDIPGKITGHIDIDGINPLKDRERLIERVGIVFQNPDDMFATLRVEDEIAFSLERRGISRDEIKLKIESVLKQMGLKGLETREIVSLSGGEKQKLAIACVEATKPEYLFLDEPTAFLDPISTEQFFSFLHRTKRQFIIVEHKIDTIVDIISKVVLINENGELEYCGKPKELFYSCKETRYYKPKLINLSCILREKGIVNRITTDYNEIKSCIVGNASRLHKMQPVNIKNGNIAIKVKDLRFSYGQKSFIYADYEVYEGMIHIIIGNNGVGKTTLLNIIAGFEQGYSGEITFLGNNLRKVEREMLYKNIGYVFQNPETVFFNNSVKEEIEYTLSMSGVEADDIMEWIKIFHLERTLELSPFNISTGEKRRLSILLMIIAKKKLLLIDEPTFGQDYETKMKTIELLRSVKAKGITMIIVTHDTDVAFDCGDFISIMKRGGGLDTYRNGDVNISCVLETHDPIIKITREITETNRDFPQLLTVEQWNDYCEKCL